MTRQNSLAVAAHLNWVQLPHSTNRPQIWSLEKRKMGTIIVIAMIFGTLLAIAAIICGTILIILKTRDSRITDGKSKSEEAMIIQEIYQGLNTMEQRIESLETILMDSQGKDQKKKWKIITDGKAVYTAQETVFSLASAEVLQSTLTFQYSG